jgi:hypothetical protein
VFLRVEILCLRMSKGERERHYKQELREALSVISRFFFGRKSVSLLGLYLRKLEELMSWG